MVYKRAYLRLEVSKVLFPKILASTLGIILSCHTKKFVSTWKEELPAGRFCVSDCYFDFNDKEGSFTSSSSFTMQVCKNPSANLRYLFRQVSLWREATWPGCIQLFVVTTTSISITSSQGCLLKVLGWVSLCGPRWEHQVYEKTTSISLPENPPWKSGSFLTLLSSKHIPALREHPSGKVLLVKMLWNTSQKQDPPSPRVLILHGFLVFS